MKRLLFSFFAVFIFANVTAQSLYTLIQGGGNLGLSNRGYDGAFNGYTLHFIFGKNFNDKAYLGFGLGNERFKGNYAGTEKVDEEAKKYKYDQNLFPLFVDGRLPFAAVGEVGRLGVLANAGYAPRLSTQYDKGFLFKSGLFYLHETPGKTDWTVSASYGYQQLTKNIFRDNFKHQHINLSIGLMLK